MIRYFLARGDRAGSAVITQGLPNVTCSNPPPRVEIATLGMKTYCAACKREGFISPQGPRRPGTGPNGQPWALSGDINICGCNPPPVFYAERAMKMTFTAEQAVLLTRKAAATPTESVANNNFDQYFRLINQHTGAPLVGVRYRIVTDNGERYEGRTDSQGYTQRVSSDLDISATLHVIEDETPVNPGWDRYL